MATIELTEEQAELALLLVAGNFAKLIEGLVNKTPEGRARWAKLVEEVVDVLARATEAE